VLDGVAYSNRMTGPWIPMSTTTGVFREPKQFPKPQPAPATLSHDHENYAIDDIDVI
jgi:hypothetical protein